jgi:MerR family copper efflux transcriptional regulator
MQKRMTIGELSKTTGLTTKTIRFYESIGLIDKAERGENGYRVYTDNQIETLALIKNARDLGLPIPQIKKLMVGCQDGDCSHSQEYIDKEIADYLGVLEVKMKEMTHLRDQLQKLRKTLAICKGDHDSKYCCNVLGQIAQPKKGGESE